MKRIFMLLYRVLLVVSVCSFVGCGNEQLDDAENMGTLEKELIAKFGEDAFYTNISIVNDDVMGSMVALVVAKDAQVQKLEEWGKLHGKWQKTSDVDLKPAEGIAFKDCVFRLGNNIKLSVFDLLIDEAKKKLRDEKNITEVVVHAVSIAISTNKPQATIEFFINLESKTGEGNFLFSFDKNGKLIYFNSKQE